MPNINRYIRRALKPVDIILDSLTSYRLVLFFLCTVVGWAVVAGLFDQVPYESYEILFSAGWLTAVCLLISWLSARLLNISKNKESDYITALILVLILSPATSLDDYLILAAAGTIAMLSKFLLVIGKRHIFNPAAFGAFGVAELFGHYPSWWVGTDVLLPVLLVGGFLIVRKVQRFYMVSVFLITSLAILSITIATSQTSGLIGHNLWIALTATPLLFLATIMLTEPLTSPAAIAKYMPYALVVGVFYSVTRLGVSPEQALLIGNVLAYSLDRSKRYEFEFVGRKKDAEGIYSYVFAATEKVKFTAGQYMQWTIPEHDSDSRGNRRYLTISSSPTETNLKFTLRIPSPSSSFKQKVQKFEPGDKILASHLAGSFVLPKDKSIKLVFIAGGVGITPFASMAKYMVDTSEHRNVTLIYSASSENLFAFKTLFEEARTVGLKTHYQVANFDTKTGLIDSGLITKVVPDRQDRLFYISGPYTFVNTVHETLNKTGISDKQIISDYFPGYG